MSDRNPRAVRERCKKKEKKASENISNDGRYLGRRLRY